ncbi:Ig-like domain repeat protein, partial [Methanobrevibacter smithii]|uniref:Ig-like domain repeat protein n=1 Tax=Methanobrevibacter smithii TaxID=2173 RepID=UPI0038506A94
FYKNRAFWWAGAIHTHGGANTTIYNSNFTDNVAGWNGGALYTYSYLQIYNTTFTGNNCTTNNGGGAIGACDYLTKYYITINNSLFENNANICKNTGRGGAISVMDEGGLTIHNTKFINNSAAIGQAICAYYVEGYGDDPNIELINNTFINHTGAADTLTIKLKTGTNTTAILKNNTYLNSTIKLKTFNIVPTSSNIEINKEYEFKVIIELDNAGGYDEDILNKTFYKLYVNEIFEKEFGPESTFKLNITQKETLLTIIPTIGYGNSKNITITSRNTTTLTLGVKEINKTDVTIISTINPGATGNVVFTFQGKEYLTKIENGQATLKLNLMPGNYDIKVRYGGDKNYIPSKNNLTFTVDKLDSNLNITSNDIIEGENATVVITLPEDATGSVNVTAGDKSQIVTVVNGTAKVIFTSLPAGKYNITAIYSGDSKYAPANETVNFTVINNKITNLNISDIVMIYKDGTRMVAVLTDYKGNPIANATVYFTINGVTYVRTTDVNGSASIGLNLGSGVYGASVYYNGSDMYDKVSKNITVTINPTVLADDLVKMYKNATKFSAKFTDSTGKALVNSDVRFNINGVFYTRTTDANGVASLAINLRPGDYILTAYNPVNGEQKGVTITVKSLIVQNDLTKYYLNASRFQATIYNKDGSLAVNKNVTFNINGVFYIRTTDSNGVVSLAINLRPGDYIITTIFDGLDIGNKVTVLPTLVTKDLNMKYLDGSNFTAQTLDSQGKALANQTVSFNVNGVFYHRITNEDGIASLRIRLMAGEYIITSYWNNFQTGNTIKISP